MTITFFFMVFPINLYSLSISLFWFIFYFLSVFAKVQLKLLYLSILVCSFQKIFIALKYSLTGTDYFINDDIVSPKSYLDLL